MKLTKRKGFNFFRSYFDVYNELENDADKVAFMDALLDRQFMGVKPTDLKGMAKFAYISQTNSIDSQVKGFETKTGIKLSPSAPTKQGGAEGGTDTPTLQVEEKGKEKEETTIERVYNKFVDEVGKGEHTQATEQWYMRFKIRNGTLTPLLKEFQGQLIIDKTIHKNTLEFRKHFNNWLNKQEQIGKLKSYKN